MNPFLFSTETSFMKHSGTTRRLCVCPLPILFVVLLFLCSCSTKSPAPPPGATYKSYKIGSNWYHPLPDARGFTQRGLASWYGKKFHGRKTASGEIYNMYAMTAAHKTLPLGTFVRVKNLKNRKEVVVKVNDRGPFVRKRIIDLSYSAAKKLDIVGPGTAPVEVVALGAGPSTPAASASRPQAYTPVNYARGTFVIQIGAFKNSENARRLVSQLKNRYKNVHIAAFDGSVGTFYRVRVGRCSSLKEAYEYESIMIRDGFPDAFTVAED